MNHRFIAKAFPFVKTPVESRQVDASEDDRNELLRPLTSCSRTRFVDFMKFQYLSHVVGSFVVIILSRQKVVLSEVRMGCLQFLVRN